MDSLVYAHMFDWFDESMKNKTVYVPDSAVENYEYILGDVEIYDFVPLSERPKGDVGDVNNNGKIDILDVVDLQTFLTQKRPSTGLNPDINGDGQVNVFDFILLKQMILNSDK